MHLRNTDIKQFQDNTMNTEEMIRFLEHLDECDFCMERFLDDPSDADISAPSYLKEQILTRAAQPDVQASKAVKQTSRKLQLFYYSLRTAAGVAAALFLLFSLGNTDLSALFPMNREPVVSAAQTAGTVPKDYLDSFSRKISSGLDKNTEHISSYLDQISNFFTNGGK